MCWLTSRWKPIQHQPVCCPRPDTFNPFLKHEPPQSPSIQVSVRGKNHMLLSLRQKLVQFSLCGKFHCGLVPEHSPCLSSIMGTFLGCYFAQDLPSLQQIIWEDKKFHLKKYMIVCVFHAREWWVKGLLATKQRRKFSSQGLQFPFSSVLWCTWGCFSELCVSREVSHSLWISG